MPQYAGPARVGTDVPGALTRVQAITSAFGRLGLLRSFRAWNNCAESRQLAGMVTGIAKAGRPGGVLALGLMTARVILAFQIICLRSAKSLSRSGENRW